MDTDDLSDMAYELIAQTLSFSDTLKAELRAMSRNDNNEDDWLFGVQEHCREILADPEAYVNFLDLEEAEGLTVVEVSELVDTLLRQMEVVVSTPLMDRGIGLQK